MKEAETDLNRICLYNGTVFTGITSIEECTVMMSGGKIENVLSNRRFDKLEHLSSSNLIDVQGKNISPGLIDTHIHGIYGYGTEDCSVESILGMSRHLPEFGVTSFIPTIYPMELHDMEKAIRAVTQAMGQEEGARILGIHMEGPFISKEKLGVQKPDYVKAVDLELFEHLWEVSQGTIISMTVAPELKHMRELALAALKKGILLQVGHSNATYEQMVEGIEAGILHATHFFNAMRSLHHRDPGVVGAILIHQELSCEVIADNFHLHPAIISFLLKEKGSSGIILVTDGLKPTGLTEGKLSANNEEVVYRDGLFHRVSDDTIAGSSLTLNKGVFNMTENNVPMQDALKMATLNPARTL
ncbi:MAG: N-acetylglucosamine-6-phosphate deacetylase, partial [Spirochaetia bacterium]|nr:N-acetylglucosamine-6-phosphate deacetylase [Spirochaetia bacterium]